MKSRGKHRLAPLALALGLAALAACATLVTHEQAQESLRGARSCCASPAQFKYEPLGASDAVSFKLDRTSDAFEFPTGKSYFKAFRLPERALPYRLKVTSYALGEVIRKAHIFYPQVALLDERYAVVGRSAADDFVLSKAGMKEAVAETWGVPVKVEGTVLVDTPAAKYVLVYTTQDLMQRTSPYATRQVIPVIVPGLVTALPGQVETVQIRHSPYGLLRIQAVGADAVVCRYGTEADIEPKSAVAARYTGRDARLFVDAVAPGSDPAGFDAAVVLRGAEVLGGTVAIIVKDGCFAGRKFLSGIQYIYAVRMLERYRSDPALRGSDRVELAALRPAAERGDALAQLHVGLAYAWGRGIAQDRRASIDWLERSAGQRYAPAMLALGMALSGPGALLDEARKVGEPPRSDEFTDRAAAYRWLDAASRASDGDVRAEAALRLKELRAILTPDELKRAQEPARVR